MRISSELFLIRRGRLGAVVRAHDDRAARRHGERLFGTRDVLVDMVEPGDIFTLMPVATGEERT